MPADYISAVRARGSDARDLRDAIHEAYHAVTAKLTKPWERERIHRGLLRLPRVKKWGIAMLVHEEVDARAIERLACARFGIEYDAEHWVLMAAMETCKTFGVGMPLEWWTAQISERCTAPRITMELDSLLRKLSRPPRSTP